MIFAANWKMHITPAEARAFAEAFLPAAPIAQGSEVWFFPSAVTLSTAVRAFRGRPDVRCGAQDVHWEPKGAFTGATSVALAAGAGATLALVGHSERRHVFGETDEETGRKVRAAVAGGLTPVLCVGETLAQREAGETMAVVLRQLHAGFDGVDVEQAAQVVVAYEPVWAIGTGKVASPAQAQEAHAFTRQTLADLADEAAAGRCRILYGGSVKPDNVDELMAEADIDGALVGGASLDADSFLRIVQFH